MKYQRSVLVWMVSLGSSSMQLYLPEGWLRNCQSFYALNAQLEQCSSARHSLYLFEIEMLQAAIPWWMKENHYHHDFCLWHAAFTVILALSFCHKRIFCHLCIKNFAKIICNTENFSNSGKLSLVSYTKDFGRITRFWGNDLATVPYTAFCLDLLFK